MHDRRLVLSAALATSVLAASPAVAAAHQGWKTAADVGQVGLVSLALGKSVVEEDWKGVGQLGLSVGVAAGLTTGLKYALPEQRPDRSDDKSFPSGHTSTSFAAAGYLQKRYGWRWGLPATLAATVVGVARVESKDHHWYDVVVGAMLGEATAYLLSTPRDTDVKFLPWADSHGAGFALAKRF